MHGSSWPSLRAHFYFKPVWNLYGCNLLSIIGSLRSVDQMLRVDRQIWVNVQPQERRISWLVARLKNPIHLLSPFQQQPCCIWLRTKHKEIWATTWNLGILLYMWVFDIDLAVSLCWIMCLLLQLNVYYYIITSRARSINKLIFMDILSFFIHL